MSRLEEREAALLALASRVVELAGRGESLEAYALHNVGTSVSAFEGAIERLTSAETLGVGLRLIVGGALGFAATSDVSDEGLALALAEARSNAELGTPDLGNVLPSPPTMLPEPVPGLVDGSLPDVPAARKVAIALELDRLTASLDPRVRRAEGVSYGDAATSVAVCSSAGVAASYSRTDAYAFVSALARSGDETQTGSGFTEGRGVDALDLTAAAREAVDRSVRLLGARKPATATVPVVLDRGVTADFLGVLADAFSADAVQKGRSLLAGQLGQRVASEIVTIVDDGRAAGSPGAAPFDDEGVATRRTPVITAGVLTGYLHNTETAAREGGAARSTGNAARGSYATAPGVAPTNLLLDHPGIDPADVLRMAGTGLYVQQVSGIHSGVNQVSGELSVGATGLWIRDGELAEPVRELTVSSTIPDMLGALLAVGNDRRWYPRGGSFAGCTVLIGAMTVAGS
ncbi:MAG: TldD/PmbA family protein [Frankiaceae bacterium]